MTSEEEERINFQFNLWKRYSMHVLWNDVHNYCRQRIKRKMTYCYSTGTVQAIWEYDYMDQEV